MALSKKEIDNIIVSKAMRAASKRRTATKIIVIALISALILSGGAWGIISFIEANSMLISINNTKEGLTLCTESSFEKPTTKLNMNGPEKMNAFTYIWFNTDSFLGKDGAHHGENYICYSFYLKNVSPTSPCLYTMAVKFTKDTKDVSSAVRVMLIESDDGCENEVNQVRVFAKAKEDGTAEYISYNDCVENQEGISLHDLNLNGPELLNTNMTYPFVGQLENVDTDIEAGYFAMRESGRRLSHDSYIKITVIIWLEGTDLQCVNDILGGKCSIQLEFSIDEYLDPEYYGD